MTYDIVEIKLQHKTVNKLFTKNSHQNKPSLKMILKHHYLNKVVILYNNIIWLNTLREIICIIFNQCSKHLNFNHFLISPSYQSVR